ncbi:MAG: adenine phosphoribosyltransferase [Chloroflexota bacterium]|nr:MAG: adenine phosphoribosyltransferase [Chloroflexota bacterium]
MDLKDFIRDVPDFPQKGILFRDITPILKKRTPSNSYRSHTTKMFELNFDTIVGVESRGFLFGAPLACAMGKSLCRSKEGKLPGDTFRLVILWNTDQHPGNSCRRYRPGSRVLVIDDLLATGGTIEATAEFVERSQGVVAGIGLVIELNGLGGRERLKKYDVFSLIQY